MRLLVFLFVVLKVFVIDAERLSPETVNLTVAFQDEDYVVYLDVNIGTPAQTVKLTIDLFTTETSVVDKDAKVSCNNGNPILFDYTKSSSYSLVKNYTDKFGNYYFLAQDKIKLNKNLVQHKFNLTDKYPSDWGCNLAGGSVGFGLHPSQEDLFIQQIVNDYSQRSLTFAPNKQATTDSKVPQLSLTLGGKNSNACSSTWSTTKCNGGDYQITYPGCTFEITGYSFGSYTMKRSASVAQAAISFQKFFYVPSTFYDKIMRLVDYEEKTNSIPCNSTPNFSIFINKNDQFTMKGEHYVGANVGNDRCEFLIINGETYGLDPTLLVLPIGFFSQNCQALDYLGNSMSLAVAK